RAKKRGSPWTRADVDDFMFFCMLGTILGGRIGYVLFYGLSFWAQDPWYPVKVWDGGMSFHRGFFCVFSVFSRRGPSSRPAASAALPTCSTSPRRCRVSESAPCASATSSTASCG